MSPILLKVLRFMSGITILFVGFLAMKGLIGMKESPKVTLPENTTRPVRTIEVINTGIIPETPVEGRVEAWRRIDLFAEVNGVLQMGGSEFREGMTYKNGDVLLSLDDTEVRASLQGARAQFLQLVTGMLAGIKVDFPERISVWEEYVRRIDVVNELPELPETGSDREGYYVVNRGVEASYHTIKGSEERLSKYTIRAPFDGFVANALVRPGSLVRAGQPLGTFVGSGIYEIKTAIQARYLETVSKGDEAVFKDELDRVVAVGIVDRIAGNVNAQTQSATVFCKVEPVEGMESVMRDGRYLSGVIRSSVIANSIELSLNLVDSDNKVFIVKDDLLKKVEIEVVFKSFKSIVVLGLEDGTIILAEPVIGAYEGMAVKSSNSSEKG
ncbi:MAG TPA: HlyD family efflux transporter periplasmic adaptor subunit [Flavobacteriales bacterium]|nr:HlyD family efflux transporter periplasmic adaptor subunit [Flavobacteriales bacterium]